MHTLSVKAQFDAGFKKAVALFRQVLVVRQEAMTTKTEFKEQLTKAVCDFTKVLKKQEQCIEAETLY